MTVPMEESSEITSGEEELNSMLSPCTECVENSTKRNNKVHVAFGEKADLWNFLPKKISRIMYFLNELIFCAIIKKNYTNTINPNLVFILRIE